MKYIIPRFILVTTAICIGLAFFGSSAHMQKSSDKKISDTDIEDFIKVTLITDSDKYKLKKDKSISVIVRIDNNSDKTVKLRHDPVFYFERVGIKAEDKKKLIWDNYYTGRIASNNSSNLRNVSLEKGKYLEFVVDINELELKDLYSSINVWENIFKVLNKGDYTFQAKATIDFSNDENENIKGFVSNRIIISNIGAVEN